MSPRAYWLKPGKRSAGMNIPAENLLFRKVFSKDFNKDFSKDGRKDI
ncbi:hypothetical protein FACS189460_0590 [Deltaproteobacteria bacterium]|nr:hypothetical protein FACS189460_0590 [Deltaproteobacteria bacterium]